MTDSFNVKTLEQIRTDYLRTYREALIRRGVSDPDVSPGTEIYIHATALAQELSALGYNLQILAADVLPDTAQGDGIVRHAALSGLSLRPAGGSTGPIVFDSTISPVAVALGAQLTDTSGLKYKVTVGGSYSDGYDIPIAAVDTGSATNLAEGSVLRWSTAPAYANSIALVGAGGLTGGVDEETLEGLRTRTLDVLRAPPGSGNASEVNAWAEASSPSVQKSFANPCANGPGTVHVAVLRAPTSTDKDRDIDSITLSTVITPYIQARLPEYVELTVTTVQNQDVSVSFGLSLPDYTTGLGWLDQTPWPTNESQGYADVTAVTSSTVFTVDADVAPADGLTQICWLSPVTWTVKKAKVVSHSGSAGAYTITIDTPFTDIAIGDLITPQARNIDTYFDAVLSQFASLGPGEKTDLAGLLPRALRQPLTSQSWPAAIGPSVLKFLVSTGDEILDVAYLYRSDTTPDLPTLITDPPFVLVPQGIAFYPLT